MAKDEKTFAELVKDAPSGAEAGTVTVVGLLAKSDDPKKFVLHLQGGHSHTVDTAAVKKHTVLGHSVGHAVVQLEIDRESLPPGLSFEGPAKPMWSDPLTWADKDHSHGLPHQPQAQLNIGGTLYMDHYSTFWADHSFVWSDYGSPPSFDAVATWAGGDISWLAQTVGDPGPSNYPGYAAAGGGAAPFSLATQHQVPQAQIEMLNLRSGGVQTYHQNSGETDIQYTPVVKGPWRF